MATLENAIESASKQEWVPIGMSGFDFIEHNGCVMLVKKDNRGFVRTVSLDEQTVLLGRDSFTIVATNGVGGKYPNKPTLCTEDGLAVSKPMHDTIGVYSHLESYMDSYGAVASKKDASLFCEYLNTFRYPNRLLMNVIRKGDELVGAIRAGKDSADPVIKDGKIFVKYA